MTKSEASRLIIETGRRLYQKEFIAGPDGNLSIRLNPAKILITASGICKGFLSNDDLVVVDNSGRSIQGAAKPSSEMLMHLAVYANRPEINACCHAHPPYATAFAVAAQPLPAGILPEVILTIGEIPLTRYAPPGTPAVPRALEEFLPRFNAFVLRNHGVLTIGRDMTEAFQRMETVEHYARIVYIARQCGNLNFLDKDEVRRLEDIRDSLRKLTE